jgi:tRNA (guanosine-2'-O-)-methyltransferase
LSEEILQRADGFLKIDGRFTESLNISVSAAIIIQNLTNKIAFKIDWHLSEEEMLEKRLATY